jgi:oxalate decarboxylase/phosphoglucose isomerase-like protein (cupin superfamily)
MVDLSCNCGFTLKFDESKGRIVFGDEVSFEKEDYVSLDEIVPVLLNKYLKYPERVYKYHRNVVNGVARKYTNLVYDIIYIPYGLLGIEFMKTHIYTSPYAEGKYDSMIELLNGEMMVIMQKNEDKLDEYQMETYVEDMIIVKMNPGERLAIPSGYYYSFVNIGTAPVVFAKLGTPDRTPVDYSTLRREKGLAYYIISKNAKVETVANPKYKMRCDVKNLTMRKLQRDEELKSTFAPFESKDTLFKMFYAHDHLGDMLLTSSL